jgi:hypothetical protein
MDVSIEKMGKHTRFVPAFYGSPSEKHFERKLWAVKKCLFFTLCFLLLLLVPGISVITNFKSI